MHYLVQGYGDVIVPEKSASGSPLFMGNGIEDGFPANPGLRLPSGAFCIIFNVRSEVLRPLRAMK